MSLHSEQSEEIDQLRATNREQAATIAALRAALSNLLAAYDDKDVWIESAYALAASAERKGTP